MKAAKATSSWANYQGILEMVSADLRRKQAKTHLIVVTVDRVLLARIAAVPKMQHHARANQRIVT
jgi:hypothetical protein